MIIGFPRLNAVMLPWPELQSLLYRKLILNASVNPLAGILACSNGEIVMEKNMHGKTALGIALYEAYQVLGHWIIGNTNDSGCSA